MRLILAQAALEDLHMTSIDISHAFINGDLDEEIYMKPPPGFILKPGPLHTVLEQKQEF